MKILKKVLIAVPLILLCAIIFFSFSDSNKSNNDKKIIMHNLYEQEAYLNLMGWEVTFISESNIKIPENFEGVYNEYAQLQEKQKLPIKNFKGKFSTRFLYNVENYNGKYPVYAELLIIDDQLIAAALTEQKPDGFIKEIY